MSEQERPLLVISDLSVTLRGRKVLNGLDLKISDNEIVGFIGESGAGKTVTALTILRLLPSNAILTSGQIRYRGRNLIELSETEMRKLRGTEIGIVLQDPLTALNPVIRIDKQLSEGMRIRLGYSRRLAMEESERLLSAVGISNPQRCLQAYPHQLSGGMRQRILIASALSCKPRLLICDEITSSVDSIVQSQLLTLLKQLRNNLKLSILLITHNLRAAHRVADRICVLLEGKVVEEGRTDEIFEKPAHAFTRSLVSSVSRLEKR